MSPEILLGILVPFAGTSLGAAMVFVLKKNISESLQKILEALYPEQDTFLCEIPYDKMSLASQYRSVLRIEIMEHRENGILAQISGETRLLLPFRKYAV